MPSTADIRKKIRSVKNTEKITKAMKMVAASKLRRAEQAISAARPYAQEMAQLLTRVAARVPTEPGQAPHPLLEVQSSYRRVLLLVLTSDRGLCGGFNNNTLRMAERWVAEHKKDFEVLEVATLGRRAAEYFKKRKVASSRNFPGVFDDLSFRRATEIAEGLAEEYIEQDLDGVFIMYNEFKSAMSQILRVEQVLPVEQAELPPEQAGTEYIFEADERSVLEELLPRYVAIDVWRALLESWASEQGARMSAMDSASRNARELVDTLTLQYNKARQAAITRALLEVVAGAEALNG
jgi:F-type H+-transporting ATPase subunit gamma